MCVAKHPPLNPFEISNMQYIVRDNLLACFSKAIHSRKRVYKHGIVMHASYKHVNIQVQLSTLPKKYTHVCVKVAS